MTKRRLVVVPLVALTAGCGHGRSFVDPLPTKTGPMRFLATEAPSSTAPGLGPAHFAFLSPRLGFVATTGGGYYQEHTGYIQPTAPGLIERTTDGGASWQVVRREPDVVFHAIAFADRRHGVAAGNVVAHRACCAYPPARPRVLVTADGGRHWRRRRVPAAVARSMLLVPAARTWYAAGRRLLVSRDGGRTWSARSLPRGAALTTFASAEVGFTVARTSCGRQIWKTTDGGGTWRPLPITCARSYSSLEFVDAQTGWAATGVRDYDYGSELEAGPVLIRRTDDGGATWRTVSRVTRWQLPDTRLHFADSRHGWAVSRATQAGAHAHFSSLHRTVDGGRSWSVVRYPALPSAFSGANAAWAGDEAGGQLWRTTDSGRSWQLRVRPANVWPSALLVATRSRLVIDGAAGTLRSGDGGRSWSSTPAPSAPAIAGALHQPAYLRVRDIDVGGAIPQLSRDGGRTWRPLHRPRITQYDAGDVAFTDPDRGLLASGQGEFGPYGRVPVFATHDGGRTWRQLPVPRYVERDREVTRGPGIVVIRRPPLLYVSTDEGRHWGSVRVRDDFWDCGASRPQHDAIWILCSLSVNRAPSLLLRSDDGGSSWRKLNGSVWLDPRLIALDDHEAWAIANPRNLNAGGGRALWHSTDGGSTWREVWPNVPGETVVRDHRYFGPHVLR
jgi:photosystem II stability/assembly factor-like uncharacterized protein